MHFEIGSEEEKENVLLVDTKVDWLFAGVAEVKDPSVPGGICLYSCIDLYYPEDSLPVVLAVAKEMDRLKQRPSVYIDRKQGRFYVAVIFEFTVQGLEFLIDVIAGPDAEDLKDANDKITNFGLKIIMTGEAELGGPVNHFLDLYKEKGSFTVLISETTDNPQKGNTLWHVTLDSFIQGMVCPW